MKTRSTALTLAAIALVMLAGCTTTSEPIEVPEPVADTGSEFSQGETPAPEVVPKASPTLATAYFDFDRAEVRGDMRAILKANAEALEGSNLVTMIEGHADERGSAEYNLALGERRAESVRKYLTALGVSGSQLRIVSYGEDRPAVTGHDESSWRLNRRAEFHTR